MKFFFFIVILVSTLVASCATQEKVVNPNADAQPVTAKANPFGLPDPSRKFTADDLKLIEKEMENLKAPPEFKAAWYYWLARQWLELAFETLKA